MTGFIQVEFESEGVVFRDHGGMYIDVHSFVDGVVGHAFDVISAWDYAAGERSVPFTVEAVTVVAREWVEGNEGDVL